MAGVRRSKKYTWFVSSKMGTKIVEKKDYGFLLSLKQGMFNFLCCCVLKAFYVFA